MLFRPVMLTPYGMIIQRLSEFVIIILISECEEKSLADTPRDFGLRVSDCGMDAKTGFPRARE